MLPSPGASLMLPAPCWGGELAGALAASFIPAPSLSSCLQVHPPSPQLSFGLFFFLSLPPLTVSFSPVLPLLSLNPGSPFPVIFLLPQHPSPNSAGPSRNPVVTVHPPAPLPAPFLPPFTCPDSISLPSYLPVSLLRALGLVSCSLISFNLGSAWA